MPQVAPSPDLQLRLKVIASREQLRQKTRRTFANAFAQWRDGVSLTLKNLMRPLMLPVAGGIASACILFGMLVPDFAMEVHPVRNDVLLPVLYTRASVDYLMPIAMSGADLEIDVHVDESGKMTDYQVISGQNLLANPQLRRRIESTLLLSKFSPATTFGQPTNGRIRVRLVRDEVDVKG